MAASFFGSWKLRSAGRKRSSPAARYSSRANGEIGSFPAIRRLVVPWIVDAVHEVVSCQREPDAFIDVDVHARVWILTPILDQLCTDGLEERVSIREAALLFVSEATVEIVFDAVVAPEGEMTHRERVVDELGDRTVDALDHLAQVCADLEVADRVVVVVEERSDPESEAEVGGPMVESVPEDRLCLLGFERAETFARLGRDEVDGVVAIPVLEAVFPVGVFVLRVGELSEPAPHVGERTEKQPLAKASSPGATGACSTAAKRTGKIWNAPDRSLQRAHHPCRQRRRLWRRLMGILLPIVRGGPWSVIGAGPSAVAVLGAVVAPYGRS